MKTVTLKFKDDEARYALYALRKLYNRDGRTGLAKLCRMAVTMEVGIVAEKDMVEAQWVYDEECETALLERTERGEL